MNHTIACGDTLELIKQIPTESIDLLVTSPPYWAKRVYNGEGEIGCPCGATLPENAQYEDGGHWGCNEAQHGLEHIKEVETLDAVDGYGEHDGYSGTDNGHDASHEIDATLGSVWTETLDVDIHRKDGGKGIECRANS